MARRIEKNVWDSISRAIIKITCIQGFNPWKQNLALSRVLHKPVNASDPLRLSLQSSSNSDLIDRWAKQKIGDKAFSVAAPRVWNRLPTELKITWSTTASKRYLKTTIFLLPMEHRTELTNWLITQSHWHCNASLISQSGHTRSPIVTFTVTIMAFITAAMYAVCSTYAQVWTWFHWIPSSIGQWDGMASVVDERSAN